MPFLGTLPGLRRIINGKINGLKISHYLNKFTESEEVTAHVCPSKGWSTGMMNMNMLECGRRAKQNRLAIHERHIHSANLYAYIYIYIDLSVH